uniref:Ribonuclease toxin, BrnT, of type II toxin-antitoxin system n=1 Tax=Candidatus Kentrum sp. FW TaxID=2126338 RepID=A0A450TNC9_9GAMM|nr:MAG: Ribonuclease toxin, BrnT, of type II toxin-antitoxin system [Candidatus Kentron sp. FW]
MKLEFEWDNGKAERNIEKHGVSFDEARSIFNDPEFITVVDAEHSMDEECYISIGLSGNVKTTAPRPHGSRRKNPHHQRPQGNEKRREVL